MKIYGSGRTNFNPYNNQQQKQIEQQKQTKKEDQLEISNAAKKLQESKQQHTKRASYVEGIKKAVQSGEYKINYEKTSQKMIDYWSKQK